MTNKSQIQALADANKQVKSLYITIILIALTLEHKAQQAVIKHLTSIIGQRMRQVNSLTETKSKEAVQHALRVAALESAHVKRLDSLGASIEVQNKAIADVNVAIQALED